MGDDEKHDANDGIAPARSAYNYYAKENSVLVKDELIAGGKDSSMGAITSLVASRWRALTPDQRAKYETMADEDRRRYLHECALRDEEALLEQEERRKANAVGEITDSRVRGSTLKSSDAIKSKADAPKRKRELSEAEKERHQIAKEAKQAEQAAVKAEQDKLKKERAEQAEARLKYLLSQSDIFSHFGAVKGLEGGSSPPPRSSSSTTTAAAGAGGSKRAVGSRRGASSSAAADELDEDERAMAMEEADDDDDENGNSSSSGSSGSPSKHLRGTMLTKQPNCIGHGTMREYQLEGLNWMVRLMDNGINGILADEMGLGKTLQSISVLAYMHEFRKTSGPHLVMVPKSTLSNWCNEFKRWCPVLRVLRFHGNKEERQEVVDTLLKPANVREDREWDVVVTTYEIVNLERNALTKLSWNYLIIDEAHRLKNEASQFSQTVRQLQTKHRLLLTGTPLQNNLHELWALLNFLLPDVFASAEQFDEWFNLDVDDQEAKQRMISQLHKLLRPFMLRRLKADVEKSLPPKSETILFTGMSSVQKNLYRQVLLRDIDTINSSATSNSNGSRTAILNIVMQLRKCCNHPYLFPGIEDRSLDPMGEHLYQNCGKMVLLHKLLQKMKERGHRVLIFSQMTRMIDILEDYLISQGYLYCRIDGNTSYEDREDRITDFNSENSDKFVFVLSTRAGGLGINLQTADTVILYDSDWNPQADLQAQDRAHRIGQKKPVQVFRLVTDETVEVKVVERAQQKLKLDAMVVQQGRLQDKEKKMSKQDLLDTLRFGADKIFRSKDSSITDADIDLILEEGRKRTEEIAEKIQAADKGDMYDFRLDGGMGTQIFEGRDYSDKAMRQQELNALAGLQFIDPGKRERKAISSYAETIAREQQREDGEKKVKIPRHLRLGRMDDWQFFNKARLFELHNEEIKLFEQLVQRGEVPPAGSISSLVLLPPELHEEKTQLLEAGFGAWSRMHFNNFIRASGKHGRQEFDKISKDVGRPVEEVKRYAEAFWTRGSTELATNEWERVTKQIERGEKRLDEISRLTTATAKLITMFEDPWEELTIRNVGSQGRVFNAVEDRYLLCLTHIHGYGNWDQVRNSVRQCEKFRFDFFLQSCSADVLGKRCEILMRSAERELTEIERKRQVAEAQGNAAGQGGTKSKLAASSEQVKERVMELTKQIAEESKRLATTRNLLQKFKAGGGPGVSGTVSGTGTGVTVSSLKGAAGSSAGIMKAFLDAGGGKGGGMGSGKKRSAGADENGGGGSGKKGGTNKGGTGARGNPAQLVPDELNPVLIDLLLDAGTEGVMRVVNTFVEKYPTISKRQAECKINELAYKDKAEGGPKNRVWRIRPEFEHLASAEALEKHEQRFGKAGTLGAGVKRKGTSAGGGSSGKKNTGLSGMKRKIKEDTSSTAGSASAAGSASGFSGGAGASLEQPRRYKRAFGFYVKAKRAEAEAKLGTNPDSDALKKLLTSQWEDLSPDERKPYEKKEAEDHARYKREFAAYEAAKKNGSSSSGSIKKKMKI